LSPWPSGSSIGAPEPMSTLGNFAKTIGTVGSSSAASVACAR
jgi:hypothetical protein